MNWDAIGAIGEILGAIAVFASLAYLAVQIRNNSNIAKAEAAREFANAWNVLVNSYFSDKEMTIVTRRFLNGDTDSIDEDDLLMAGARLDQTVFQHQAMLNLHEQGLISDELKDRIDNAVVLMLTSPGGKSWWRTTQHLYANRNAINQLMANDEAAQNWSEWQEDFLRDIQA